MLKLQHALHNQVLAQSSTCELQSPKQLVIVHIQHGVSQVTLEPGDVLYVPRGMEHKAETIGTDTVTFVDASKY